MASAADVRPLRSALRHDDRRLRSGGGRPLRSFPEARPQARAVDAGRGRGRAGQCADLDDLRMKRRTLLLFALAVAAPARGEWNCAVSEQIDSNLSAYLETVIGEPGAPRRHVDFYVSWSQQPGHM